MKDLSSSVKELKINELRQLNHQQAINPNWKGTNKTLKQI